MSKVCGEQRPNRCLFSMGNTGVGATLFQPTTDFTLVLLNRCFIDRQDRKRASYCLICRFEAELYALTKEEGGRHTPFFSNYRPQFFFRTADVTGAWLSSAGGVSASFLLASFCLLLTAVLARTFCARGGCCWRAAKRVMRNMEQAPSRCWRAWRW